MAIVEEFNLANLIPRNGMTTTKYGDNYVFIFGGVTSDGRTNDVFKFNMLTNTIEEINTTGDIPPKRSLMTSAIYNDKLYIVGGRSIPRDAEITDEHIQNNNCSIYSLCLKNYIWKKEAIIYNDQELFDHSMVLVNSKLYIFGGTNHSNPIYENNKFITYDIDEQKMEIHLYNIDSELVNTIGNCMFYWQGNIWLFGGWDGYEIRNELWRFDIEKNIWTLITDIFLSKSLYRMKCRVYNNNLYIVGGVNKDERNRYLYKYNLNTKQFTYIHLPIKSLSHHSIEFYIEQDELYIYTFCGWTGKNRINKIYKITLCDIFVPSLLELSKNIVCKNILNMIEEENKELHKNIINYCKNKIPNEYLTVLNQQ